MKDELGWIKSQLAQSVTDLTTDKFKSLPRQRLDKWCNDNCKFPLRIIFIMDIPLRPPILNYADRTALFIDRCRVWILRFTYGEFHRLKTHRNCKNPLPKFRTFSNRFCKTFSILVVDFYNFTHTIVRLIEKFKAIASVQTQKRSVHVPAARSNVNIPAVSESIYQNPSVSIRHRSKQLRLSRNSLQRYLINDLHLHAYKIQLTQ